MLVLLQRTMVADGNRYRPNQSGTEVPDDVPLASDALIFDGEDWIAPDEHNKRVLEEREKAREERPLGPTGAPRPRPGIAADARRRAAETQAKAEAKRKADEEAAAKAKADAAKK